MHSPPDFAITRWPVRSNKNSLAFGGASVRQSERDKRREALDFPMRAGSAVYAVDAGYAEQSRYFEAYGDYVILDHGNGYKTKYANNRKNKIEQGATLTDSIKLLKSITAPGIPPGK